MYIRSLLRAQLRLARASWSLLAIARRRAAAALPPRAQPGRPLPSWACRWPGALLAFLVYPVLLVLGWAYVRRAERNERAFTDMVEET